MKLQKRKKVVKYPPKQNHPPTLPKTLQLLPCSPFLSVCPSLTHYFLLENVSEKDSFPWEKTLAPFILLERLKSWELFAKRRLGVRGGNPYLSKSQFLCKPFRPFLTTFTWPISKCPLNNERQLSLVKSTKPHEYRPVSTAAVIPNIHHFIHEVY